ncbi:phosphoribosylpyrophosphate synthetase [Pedobacter sp. ASV28]|uniref:phosphoribosylpyrophosphate synthetase n=1 Tax=Pedobacter sp. ASV28 TaxID=2795123 RepID=UPI0018EB0D48|nr:phosphoribosylpyrophosphate synthetase [Pedobacter sp. ASV28]
MEPLFHYETVSEAIAELTKQGYTTDFNLDQNFLYANGVVLEPHQFEIVQVYRYEGNTDPADEAIVYAIRSESGLKGILVTGYGAIMDGVSPRMLDRLHYDLK